jgi:hypothetical protein
MVFSPVIPLFELIVIADKILVSSGYNKKGEKGLANNLIGSLFKK